MTLKALKSLYPDSVPVRGEIKVAFSAFSDEGVAGVIGNVISNITGATESTGFKGLGGKFARHSLMSFNENISASARFTRTDNGSSVDVFYDPSSVAGDGDPSQMQMLMGKAIAGDKEACEKFGMMWQYRVEKILIDNANNENVIRVVAV